MTTAEKLMTFALLISSFVSSYRLSRRNLVIGLSRLRFAHVCLAQLLSKLFRFFQQHLEGAGALLSVELVESYILVERRIPNALEGTRNALRNPTASQLHI